MELKTVKLFTKEESYGRKIIDRMNHFISLCYKKYIICITEWSF